MKINMPGLLLVAITAIYTIYHKFCNVHVIIINRLRTSGQDASLKTVNNRNLNSYHTPCYKQI